jgi:hypothetical protein
MAPAYGVKSIKAASWDHPFRIPDGFNTSVLKGVHGFDDNPLFLLNNALDTLRLPHEVNETAIEGFLHVLEDSGMDQQPVYWLVMARLFEAAMVCAGHYADNCEFSAAGDLLVNPRSVLIHQKGSPCPLIKQRHRGLSEQLNKDGKPRESFLQWFKNEVSIEIARPAMLQYLFEQMQQSQKIVSFYLKNARERMKKIAETIGFLSAWPVSRFEDFHQRMQTASPQACHFVTEHLCRFDTRFFERIGREIWKLMNNSGETCEFLVC